MLIGLSFEIRWACNGGGVKTKDFTADTKAISNFLFPFVSISISRMGKFEFEVKTRGITSSFFSFPNKKNSGNHTNTCKLNNMLLINQ